jgi:uncharacterized secreted protein with C-terminal beta-propeller domain
MLRKSLIVTLLTASLLLPPQALTSATPAAKAVNPHSILSYTNPNMKPLTTHEADKTSKLRLSKMPDPLPLVGSYANLQKLLEKQMERSGNLYNKSKVFMVTDQVGNLQLQATSELASTAADTSTSPVAPPAGAGGSDYSTTNVQVQGVDEADIVKTDGRYLYQVNRQRIAVVSAVPETAMKVVSLLKFNEQIVPQELYLDGDTLVVIAAKYQQQELDPLIDTVEPALSMQIMMPYNQKVSTLALVYDISNKAKLRKVREVEVSGSYLQSRKIGSSVYMLANQYMNLYPPFTGERDTEKITPQVRDSAASPAFRSIPYSDIRYFPGSELNSYLTIAGFSLDRPQEKAVFDTYLGAGQNIYASQDNLYVTINKFTYTVDTKQKSSAIIGGTTETSTDIYKFALNKGAVRYAAKGSVPGTILNQFSMDEHNGYFRIATTSGEMWRNDAYTSKNNVYVLDTQLTAKGKLENLAPGERIYSVRFMGNRGYLVTFKQVDPLFVIDLAVPEKPKVLGELKIPGYSDYLHPYDENHIIGFGKDTVELDTSYEKSGQTTAFYQGLKLAIFDVSDVTKPKEMFKEIIGDRGTDSPLLYDHKALLFSREKNLLAFPVTRLDLPKAKGNAEVKPERDAVTAYGEFAFQGAYVYNIDLVKGFQLKGTITHLPEEAITQASYYGYDNNQVVERILYIDNTLYTLSQSEIRANRLDTLAQTGQVLIPE